MQWRDVFGHERSETFATIEEAVRRGAEAAAERREWQAETKAELTRRRKVKLAENRRTAGEALSLIRKAAQALDRVAADEQAGMMRISARSALATLYEAEDTLKHGMGGA